MESRTSAGRSPPRYPRACTSNIRSNQSTASRNPIPDAAAACTPGVWQGEAGAGSPRGEPFDPVEEHVAEARAVDLGHNRHGTTAAVVDELHDAVLDDRRERALDDRRALPSNRDRGGRRVPVEVDEIRGEPGVR